MNPDPISPNLRVATETDDSLRDAAQAAAADDAARAASPGRTVRAARERAGLSVEEFSIQTRLPRPTIEALESENFSTLNEAVYVRGYYRKCAKVLGLSETDLIATYDRMLGPKAPPMPTKLLLGHDGSTTGSMGRSGGPGPLLVLGVGMAFGIGIWFAVQDAPPAPVPTVSAPLAVTPSAVPAVVDVPPAAPVDAATPVTDASLAAPVDGALPGAAAPLAPTAEAPAASPSVASGSRLVISFNASSWVRIEDADGQLLLSGTIQAGDRQVLQGRAPYSLFIGNAPGVAVEFDGQPFDLKPHIRDNATARFSLPLPAAQPSSAAGAAAPALAPAVR